ncbi:MAG: hypothetical protein HOF24_09045, partial [Flavobacteriaceae bacterium]|nr:hypothetical protein [Flavobacteriaceae bacterium]
MYRYTLLLIAIVFLSSCTNSTKTTAIETEVFKKLPNDFMFVQRAYPTGEIKTDAYSKAIQWKKQQADRNNTVLPVWEFSGPLNVGGRISDIEIPIDASETYYVGAAS